MAEDRGLPTPSSARPAALLPASVPSGASEIELLLRRFEHAARRRADWRRRFGELLDEFERLERPDDLVLEAAVRCAGSEARVRAGSTGLRGLVHQYERLVISAALIASGGLQNRAAAALRISKSTLNEKIKRHGIPSRRR